MSYFSPIEIEHIFPSFLRLNEAFHLESLPIRIDQYGFKAAGILEKGEIFCLGLDTFFALSFDAKGVNAFDFNNVRICHIKKTVLEKNINQDPVLNKTPVPYNENLTAFFCGYVDKADQTNPNPLDYPEPGDYVEWVAYIVRMALTLQAANDFFQSTSGSNVYLDDLFDHYPQLSADKDYISIQLTENDYFYIAGMIVHEFGVIGATENINSFNQTLCNELRQGGSLTTIAAPGEDCLTFLGKLFNELKTGLTTNSTSKSQQPKTVLSKLKSADLLVSSTVTEGGQHQLANRVGSAAAEISAMTTSTIGAALSFSILFPEKEGDLGEASSPEKVQIEPKRSDDEDKAWTILELLDENTGEPIENAEVKVTINGGEKTLKMKTNMDGKIKVPKLEPSDSVDVEFVDMDDDEVEDFEESIDDLSEGFGKPKR